MLDWCDPSGMKTTSASTVQELHFCMDASGVPVEYGLTIIQICMLYPRKLMFICKADLTVKTWVAEYELPTIDTYFMVNCYDQDTVSATQTPPLEPICSGMPSVEEQDLGQLGGQRETGWGPWLRVSPSAR
jgi:hypothetical protein